MNPEFRRYVLGSAVTHIVVIAAVLLVGFLVHLRTKRPKPVEIMAYIDV